jgi:hypothetical protein
MRGRSMSWKRRSGICLFSQNKTRVITANEFRMYDRCVYCSKQFRRKENINTNCFHDLDDSKTKFWLLSDHIYKGKKMAEHFCRLPLSLLMLYIYIYIYIYIYMELLVKPEILTSYIYGSTFGNAETRLFLFAVRFNIESMQKVFLCHSCV